jgi:hypothetical protein
MLFLRFQDALDGERWPEALSYCSDRVRAKSAEWPSLGTFFRETIPVDLLLARDFGPWHSAANFYGLFVDLTAPQMSPYVQWFWAIAFTNNAWLVDYPPVKLDDYIARKKAAIQARDDRIRQIRQDLEPKVKATKTRLTAVIERFVVGAPMLFRVELVNSGNATVHYQNAGIGYHPLTVLNENREPLPPKEQPSQIPVANAELAAGASAILADRVDIGRNHEITKPGKYFVQFSGRGLEIGERVPMEQSGPFGETVHLSRSGFVAAVTNFPSNTIEIEVTAAQGR